jgi:hypothetical protein
MSLERRPSARDAFGGELSDHRDGEGINQAEVGTNDGM